MKFPGRVAQLYEENSHASLREKALELLDGWSDLTLDQAVTGESVAVLIAAYLAELTRTSPSDAPRIFKRVMTDTIAVRSSV